jgi:hypothetical protein
MTPFVLGAELDGSSHRVTLPAWLTRLPTNYVTAYVPALIPFSETEVWTAGDGSFPAPITMTGWLRRRDCAWQSGRYIRLRCEDDPRCTTEQQNTHKTEVRELLYPWHPWYGRLVHIHEVLAKEETVFRCSLSGAFSGRSLEVPAWMFDRSLSARWRTMSVPYVELASLRALARLVEEADTSSQSEEMGAALVSHEASWRDVHATPVHDLSVRSARACTTERRWRCRNGRSYRKGRARR